jgi:hypothetical protein
MAGCLIGFELHPGTAIPLTLCRKIMGSWTCTCGHSEMMSCGPYSFVFRVISDQYEEVGLEAAAAQIREFYLARSEGADAEIAWLASYFGTDGMEVLADSSIISDIITRELISGGREILSCTECGRMFVYADGSDEPKVFIPDPTHLSPQ